MDRFSKTSIAKARVKNKKGMVITHIDGKKLSKTYSPNHALVNKSSSEVVVQIVNPKNNKNRICKRSNNY